MESPLPLANATATLNSRSPTVPISRLQLMQARFQTKLLKEKEKKMLQLYPESNGNEQRSNGGTVRQFFAQRRALQASGNSLNSSGLSSLQQSFNGSVNSNTFARNGPKPKQGSPVGWDKSYPLSPLDRDSSGGSSSGYDSGNSFGSNLGHTGSNASSKYGSQPRLKPQTQRKLTVPNSNSRPAHRAPSLDRYSNKNTSTNGTPGGMRRSNSQILAPTSPSKENYDDYMGTRRPQARSIGNKPVNSGRKPPPRPAVNNTPPLPKQPMRLQSPAKDQTDHVLTSVAITPKGKKPVVPAISYKPPPKPTGSPAIQPKKQTSPQVRRSPSSADPNLAECSICGRRFAPDRIEKHETICEKSNTKKRKVFDPTKMRIKGTEIEEFVRKSGKSLGRQPAQQTSAKKPDWRQKRNNFIETIRQAKAAQKHVAAGGKLSDLPPPPPMDTSDYIQCPFCNRKFSEAAAERHIPKCKNIKSNKNPDRK